MSAVISRAPFGNDFSQVGSRVAAANHNDSSHIAGRKLYQNMPAVQNGQSSPTHLTHSEDMLELENCHSFLTRNGRLTECEEKEVIEQLLILYRNTPDPVGRLESLQRELSDYDPSELGWVDTSTVQRTCMEHFKYAPVHSTTWSRLILLFARNPQRPREVHYNQMLTYLNRILTLAPNLVPKPTAPETQLDEGGDLKLIAEIQRCAGQSELRALDLERLRTALTMADRTRSGTLSSADIKRVLSAQRIERLLEPVLGKILQRSDKYNQQQYDWSLMVRLLEKAQATVTNNSKQRKDMQTNREMFDVPSSLVAPIENGHASQASNGHTVQKEQLLAQIEHQIQLLTEQADKIRKELACEQAAGATEPRDRVGLQRMLDALHKLDRDRSGWVGRSRAHQLILQYNNLHGLGLETRLVHNILASCADRTEQSVSLERMEDLLIKKT